MKKVSWKKLLACLLAAACLPLTAFAAFAAGQSGSREFVASGILKGKGNAVLAPTATAARAEVAVMPQRFIGLI